MQQYGHDIKIIRLDGERSLRLAFDSWAAEKGLIIERSAPYTPAQNGATECAGKELIRKARAMRIGANIPEDLWPEAFKTTGYLINRMPSSTLTWKSPYQMLQEVLQLREDQGLDHL